MKENEVREGDIVEIDYIEEFTKIHRNEGKAIVLWKDGLSRQPLVIKLTEYRPTWMIYDEFSKVVGHIEPREVLNKAIQALTQEPCEDAVSRQAVLDLIEHYNSDGLGSVFYGYEEGVKFANAVNKLLSVKPQEPNWIPVSERLPEKDDLYLICFDNGEYELDYFSRDTFNYSGVVAWMPLPAPYKAESEKVKEHET